MKPEDLPPYADTNWFGIDHPRDHNGCLLPTPLQAEQEKILKATMAREEAMRNLPSKSFNTLERERFQDEANARAVGIQRSFWIAR